MQQKKFRKNLFFLRQMHLNCVTAIVSTNKGMLVIRSQCVKKTAKKFSRL